MCLLHCAVAALQAVEPVVDSSRYFVVKVCHPLCSYNLSSQRAMQQMLTAACILDATHHAGAGQQGRADFAIPSRCSRRTVRKLCHAVLCCCVLCRLLIGSRGNMPLWASALGKGITTLSLRHKQAKRSCAQAQHVHSLKCLEQVPAAHHARLQPCTS